MALWTLEYGGQEKALADWKICADLTIKEVNKSKTTVSFRTTEAFDGASAPQFAFDGTAILRKGRTFGGGVWSGGSVELICWFDSANRVTSDGKQYIHYEMHDVWWFFERHPFQQTRKEFIGWTNNDPNKPPMFQTVLSSESYLGEKPSEEIALNGEQVIEVVDWINECYNPTKRGATVGRLDAQDLVIKGSIEPRVAHPRGRANTAYCSEAILEVLRSSPDAVIYRSYDAAKPTIHVKTMAKWNYATSPPTFVDYTNLPEVTITLTADQEKEMTLKAEDMRQLPGVIIKYKSFTQVNNLYWPRMTVDKFPANISDYTPEISAHVVPLPGYRLISLRKKVDVEPLADAFSADNAKRIAWWKRKDTSLDDERVTNVDIPRNEIEVVDENGNPVDTTRFQNQLMSSLPAWVGATAFRVSISAVQSFNKYRERAVPNVLERRVDRRPVRIDMWVTNAVDKVYTGLSYFDPGIAPPAGLAEGIYRAVAALQHGGNFTFSNAQVRGDLHVGVRAKAIGPNTTFTNLMVQSVTSRPNYGELNVTFGPSAMPDADEQIELALVTRWRNIEDRSGRSDGTASTGTQVDMTEDAPTENVTHGVGGESYSGVSG